MDVLHNLALGFEHALTWQNLLFCAIGCMVGTLVGLLPGLGPLATISILLPLTYSIPTGGALIMLAGIYYGAQYGDSVSAITMKIPHASSIVACIDGYQMTLKGKTGLALFTAGVSSFIGGTVAIVVLSWLAPILGEVAFLFGPADYCALMLVGFVCVSFVTTGSLLNGMAMCLIGVLLGQIGTDVNSGAQRFTMDLPFLADGVGLVSIALGCFGIAEITKNLDNKDERTPFNGKIKLIPTWPEFKRIIPERVARQRDRLVPGHPARRRPGDRPVRRLRRRQEGQQVQGRDRLRRHRRRGRAGRRRRSGRAHQFHPADEHRHSRERGHGADDGRLHHQGHPARTEHDRRPPRSVLGPGGQHVGGQLLPAHSQRAAGALLAVGVQDPLRACCSRRFCSSAASAPTASTTTWTTSSSPPPSASSATCSCASDLDAAPLMLGFILGPMLEENFRRALLLSRGSFGTFVTRPISGTLLGLIGIFIAWQVAAFFLQARKTTIHQQQPA